MPQVRDSLLWILHSQQYPVLNPGQHHAEGCEYSWGSSVVMFPLLIPDPAMGTSHPPGDDTSEGPGPLLASTQIGAQEFPWKKKPSKTPGARACTAEQPLKRLLMSLVPP